MFPILGMFSFSPPKPAGDGVDGEGELPPMCHMFVSVTGRAKSKAMQGDMGDIGCDIGIPTTLIISGATLFMYGHTGGTAGGAVTDIGGQGRASMLASPEIK